MALTLTTNRDRLAPTTTVSNSLTVGTPVETNTANERSVFFPFEMTKDPASFTVASCTTTNGDATVTTTGGGFAEVRAGDAITGTGIPTSTTVLSVAVGNNSLELSANATASGTVTLTVDPPSLTATVCAVKVIFAVNGKAIVPTCQFYSYNGTLEDTEGDETNYTSLSSLLVSPPISINIDDFLNNIRVART